MLRTHPVEMEYEERSRMHGRARSLAEQFAAVCERYGERTAVTMGAESISYDDLNRMANRIASALVERGAGTGTLVAICMERSIEMIAAMLGVVKCGAAYLPLDPGYPAARIEETIADAAPIAVLTSHSLASRLRYVAAECLFVEDLRVEDLGGEESAVPVIVRVREDGAAYVIYTSGSTGRPKGVVVSQRNLARLLTATSKRFQFTPDDVWTMFHSFAFDFSVWEIWGCLLTGGRLVIVPFGVSRRG